MRIKVVSGICEVYVESTTPEEQTEAIYVELE